MRVLRALAYRLGLRPRPGSILYSPSRDYDLKARAAIRAAWGGDR